MKKILLEIYKNNKFIQKLRTIRCYLYDYKRFINHSATLTPHKNKATHEANLIFYYHKIEKGLSLKKVKVGFGKENLEKLQIILDEYYSKYGWNDICQAALNSIIAYYSYNKNNGFDDENLYKKIELLKNFSVSRGKKDYEGGIKYITKSEIDKSLIDFKDFAYSRYSIRNFEPGDVSLDLIKEAVSIAQKTPSVCNRQTSRVYVYDEETIKKDVLKYQNGNTGFGENASKILLVTADLQCFIGASERNQSYIDGGMYAMSLIYALHSLGVGTCPLNLAIGGKIDSRLRKVANVADSEVMLMMIAVGNIPNKLNVASSYRRDSEEVITVY